MKKLLNSNLTLNDEGLKFQSLLKNRIETSIDEYVKMGYDILDLDYISKSVITSIMSSEIEFIKNYFNNKKFNVNELKIYNIMNNEEKYAEFLGIDDNGNRMWRYEDNFLPKLPFNIKENSSIKYYYLLLDINDK